MKKIFILIFIINFIIIPVEGEKTSCTLTLKILNNKHNAPFYIAIYDSAKSFQIPELATYALVLESNKENIYVIKEIREGNYALAIFQDINRNGKLDKGWFGIPREPYGFSNNPRILMGPPSFKACEFSILGDITIEIKLK